MHSMPNNRVIKSLLALLPILIASPSWSAPPDYDDVSSLIEANGFAGVCAQPCFIAGVSVEVWLPGNPSNPLPLAGNNTYIYKVTHTGGGTNPFIPALTDFEINVDTSQVTAVGHLTESPGIEPSESIVGSTVVSWRFLTSPVADGESSKLLYIQSPLMPGAINNNSASVTSQASLTAPGNCLGPLDPPAQEECNLLVEKEGCVVQQPDVEGDACEGKLTSFTFEYTGLGCDASSHLQHPRRTRCVGGASGEDPVNVLVSGKRRKRWSWYSGWWGKKHRKKEVYVAATNVGIGDSIVVDASAVRRKHIGKRTRLVITNASGSHDVIEFDRFDTSCRQPFGPGMVFGSALITSVTSTKGGTTVLQEPDDECVTSIDLMPAPHCEGDLRHVQLRYTGSDCGQSIHSQTAANSNCTDSASPTVAPVRIILTNGAQPPPKSSIYMSIPDVNAGDVIDLDPGVHGRMALTSATGYQVRHGKTNQLIQQGYLHSSCSESVDLGDQHGALQIYSVRSSEGGSLALGADVEYTYLVTNPNDSQVDQVSVDDDLLGNIANGISIPAGGTATFTTTTLIETETTNVATVTGQVGSLQCVPGTGSATINVTAPPEEPQICTEKIAAMLLQYTGPDALGATVTFKANSFRKHPVIYSNIDLTSGTILSLASENGFTIDGTAHSESDLGSKTSITINGVAEKIRTNCSIPFMTNQPAPLHSPKGDPSPNWRVVDFTQKHKDDDDDDDD